jgi:hypothetical protein
MKKIFIAALLVVASSSVFAQDADFESDRLLAEISIKWHQGAAYQHASAMRAAGLEPSYDATAAASPDLSNLAEAVEADRVVFEATGRTPQMLALMAQLQASQQKAAVARIIDYGRMSRACTQ